MSSKSNRRRGGPSALGGLDDLSEGQTLGEVTDSIMGFSRTTKAIRANPIDITNIRPDPLQPRRAVPSELRSEWHGDPNRVQEMFDRWVERINAERDSEFKWKGILSGDNSLRGREAENLPADKNPLDGFEDFAEASTHPLERSFLRLVDLAASIKRDGLTNPISVASTGNKNQYIIETGERRWLAYHMLKMIFGEKEWGDIPAREVREFSVWRQATENNARDDLNAVSKARQLALLLMALYSEREDIEFKSLEAFEHEQEFYAQVSDGNQWRVPRKSGEQLLNAMGLSTASHLRRYRAILRVAPSIWDQADDGDWTERDIRDKWKLYQEASKRSDRGHANDNNQASRSSDKFLDDRKYYAKQITDIVRTSQKAVVGQVSSQDRRDTLNKINHLRKWLTEQEELINSK